MSREIRFRAWDEINKQMLIVDELRLRNREAMNACVFVKGRGWIGTSKPELIMQFTGLTDKNGKDIFEGDIIKVYINSHFWVYRIGTVEGQGSNLYAINVYDNCSVDYDTGRCTYQVQTVSAGVWRAFSHDCEIIGNIYQDSHLLEAK